MLTKIQTKTFMTMNNKRKIIGFAGRKRSGKTEMCKMLKHEENAVIIIIANYLKFLCCDLLNIDFDELIRMKDNETPIHFLIDERTCKIINKRTAISFEDIKNTLNGLKINNVRELLQVIGTDLIRKYNPKWHINNMLKDIESYSEDKLIVIDDVRFPNEVEAIKECGGDVYFIIRPNYLNVSNHESEKSLKWQDFDKSHILLNDGTLDFFCLSFLLLYRNNFEVKLKNGIILNDNTWCYDDINEINLSFPYNCSDAKLLNEFISSLKRNNRFLNSGIIIYETTDYSVGKKLNKLLFNEEKYKAIINLYNPLIVENIKMFL